MPRIAKKDKIDDFISEENKEVQNTATKKTSKVSSKSVKTTNKTVSSKTANTGTKSSTKKAKAKTETKSKKASSAKKTSSAKKSSSKRSQVTPVKSILSRTRKSKKTDSISSSAVLEYYDLPYRYNQTVVKILAQTPTILFVYWDISDDDRTRFIDKYGEDFFSTTKPVLLVHNKTKNYSFEVEINDFANSWYLRMQEPDCEYEIELGRKALNNEPRFANSSNYIYVTSSNRLVSPNNRVLFEESDFRNVKFKNVKTGHIEKKDFGSLRLLTNIGDIYNKKHKVYSFYMDFYKDAILDSHQMLANPSSGNPTSGMF